jgi:hypothetical protein
MYFPEPNLCLEIGTRYCQKTKLRFCPCGMNKKTAKRVSLKAYASETPRLKIFPEALL